MKECSIVIATQVWKFYLKSGSSFSASVTQLINSFVKTYSFKLDSTDSLELILIKNEFESVPVDSVFGVFVQDFERDPKVGIDSRSFGE